MIAATSTMHASANTSREPEHLTRDERVGPRQGGPYADPARGSGRVHASRSRDPVGLLLEQETTRVPELVPIRHGRMLASPMAYYRGAALPMTVDLAETPVSGLRVQLCGDAHLANFGAFASPGRRLVFDINDFDEALPGPFEWDVKRLAASFAVAGRANGFGAKASRDDNGALRATYRTAMRAFAQQTRMQVWYSHLDVEKASPPTAPDGPKRVQGGPGDGGRGPQPRQRPGDAQTHHDRGRA